MLSRPIMTLNRSREKKRQQTATTSGKGECALLQNRIYWAIWGTVFRWLSPTSFLFRMCHHRCTGSLRSALQPATKAHNRFGAWTRVVSFRNRKSSKYLRLPSQSCQRVFTEIQLYMTGHFVCPINLLEDTLKRTTIFAGYVSNDYLFYSLPSTRILQNVEHSLLQNPFLTAPLPCLHLLVSIFERSSNTNEELVRLVYSSWLLAVLRMPSRPLRSHWVMWENSPERRRFATGSRKPTLITGGWSH